MFLAGLGGLAQGFAQGMQARQNMQYRQALLAMAQQKQQMELQQYQQNQAALGSAWDALSGMGGGGPESMFHPLPTTAPSSTPPLPAGSPPSGPPAGAAANGSGANPPALPDVPSGNIPGAPSPYQAPADVGGMGVGGAHGNWELAHNNFAGLRIPGTHAGPHEAGFQSFPTPASGIQAISHQLDRYANGETTGKPVNTLRGIISTWAPPSENPTANLLRRASAITGFAPDQQLNLADPQVKGKVIQALIANEQGGKMPVSDAVIHQALGGAPTARQAAPIANSVVNTSPPPMPQVDPMAFMRQIAQRIEATSPNAPPQVKMMAFTQAMTLYSKFAAPQLQMAFNTWKAQTDFALRSRQIAATEGLRAAQMVQTGEIAQQRLGIERGNQEIQRERVDTQRQMYGLGGGGNTPQATKIPAKWQGMPDKAPPGVKQFLWSEALSYVQTGQMPSLGFSPGYRNQIIQLVPAAQNALGIKPTEMVGKWAETAGMRHGMFAAGTRAGQLGIAINEARNFLPMAQQASQRVDRTKYPSLNSVWEGYLRGTGDENVVRLALAAQALANAYAQVAARGGLSTDAARSNAMHILDVAYSKGQFNAASDQIMKEIIAAQSAPSQAVKDILGSFGMGGAPPQGNAAPPPAPGAPQGGGNAPAVGTIQDGYRFKGGNPADPNSWEKAQ